MKIASILCFLLSTSAASADFLDAGEAYEQKNYPTALKEYQALAKLGHHEAQHNLAVMHYLGQGTDKNPVQAYAWATLLNTADDPKLHVLQNKIKDTLTEAQLNEAVKQAELLHQEYGKSIISERLAPPETPVSTNASAHSDYNLKLVKTQAPSYPYKALKKGQQGWVTTVFEVHPDGSLRRPVIATSYPEGIFEEATLEALRKFRFKVTYQDGIKPYPIAVSQTMVFSLTNRQSRYEDVYKERLKTLKDLSAQNHPDAFYHLAMAIDKNSPVNKSLDLKSDQASINQWLFKAAQSGQIDAQYQLGNNLYSGKGGYQDRKKGVRWLLIAAENNQAQAARRLSQIFKTRPDMNPTQHPTHYWLAQAAEQGDLDAQLNYAEWLADNSDDLAHINHALDLLDAYAEERPETVIWYRTAAQLHEKSGNEKLAKKHHKKANRLAKRMGWDD
ncbi:hypothetical protein GCM10011365_12910 [Marinicella pacifica]|jgi:TonB family protein|uniref:TonB C-terminal domain-containing protein n=1 Tax=Marinicella pacifica TaxID=1171543 RepID=A0A917CP46_9GAMM|nr:TonB family protein [Marinicella pacifica]GGF93080.1 hypothetical protein GCM10011365_12910 [Marinicella pacifica]